VTEFRKKAISAFVWSAAQTLTSQGLLFLISIVLARHISPSEFGLIGMLTVFINLGDSFINSGLSQSLIREKTASDAEYSSIFFFNLVISICIYVLFYFIAPFIASFYHQDVLVNIIRVYFIVFIIKSLSIIQNTYLIKSLNFKQQFKIGLPSQILSGAFGIILSMNGFGVWSLVYSLMLQSSLECIQLWFYSNWKPLWVFSYANIRKHLRFGYKLTVSTTIDSIMSSFMNIIIGRYFSVYQVGIFTRANSLKQLPADAVIGIIGKVSQPLFAEIQDDNMRLKNAYSQIMQMSFVFLTPVLAIAFVLADPFVKVLFTEKWNDVIPYFRILIVTSLLFPVQVFNLHIINVKGRSDLNLKLEIIKVTLSATILIAAMQYGMYALLYGNVLLAIIGIFINSVYSKMFIGYGIFSQLRDIMPIMFYGFLAAGAVWLLNATVLNGAPDIYQLLVGAAFGSVVYLVLLYLIKPEIFSFIKKIRHD
jgi:O-antigen/teichoic acid export membrane protein